MSSQSSRLNSLKTSLGATPDDEYYTRAEDIEDACTCLEHGGASLKGVRVLCPCDSEESMFPPVLRAHGATVTFSSSDYRERDFTGFDMIATNPPFSLFRDFYKRVLAARVEYLILAPLTAVAYIDVFPQISAGVATAFCGDQHGSHFRFTNGKTSPCCWLTSLPVNHHYVAHSKQPQTMNDAKPVIADGETLPGINRMPLPGDALVGTRLAAPVSALCDASGRGWRPVKNTGRAFDAASGRQLFQRIIMIKEK